MRQTTLILLLVFVGIASAYLGSYLVWRRQNYMTFEQYQNYGVDEVAVGHEGKKILYVPMGEFTPAMWLFCPLIRIEERWNRLECVSE